MSAYGHMTPKELLDWWYTDVYGGSPDYKLVMPPNPPKEEMLAALKLRTKLMGENPDKVTVAWPNKTEYTVEAHDIHHPGGPITIPVFRLKKKKDKHQEITDL